jgi:hypothetical protein
MKKIFFCFLLLFSCLVQADGFSGLNYTTYAGTGATPNISPLYYSTPLSSGTVSTVNFNWGSGPVANSGRYDRVIIHYTGYFNPSYTGTYYFGTSTDDGSKLSINGITVINAWREQGPTFWQSNGVNLTANTPVSIDFWYYENGGGAVAQLYWQDPTYGWQIIPSTMLGTTSTHWTAALCCGGSSVAFNANQNNVSLVNNFINRTTNDSQVYIQQVGEGNRILVDQEGTKNNYTYIFNSGSNNNIDVTQKGNSSTVTNYSYTSVNGNGNIINITQNSTGGGKGAFATIQNNNNNLTLSQTDAGSHYAEVGLIGGNKTVNINQSGSASQMASVQLSGNPTSLTLQQSGATQNFYSIQFNCATVGGCSPINVKQGN